MHKGKVTPDEETKVLTLSTCSYEYSEARYTVHAKLIGEEYYSKNFDNIDTENVIRKEEVTEDETKEAEKYIEQEDTRYKLKSVNSIKTGKKDKDKKVTKKKTVTRTVASKVDNPLPYHSDIATEIKEDGKTMKLKGVEDVLVKNIKGRTTHLTVIQENDLRFDKPSSNDTIYKVFEDKATGKKYKVKLTKEKTEKKGKKEWVLSGEKKTWTMTYPESSTGKYVIGNKTYKFSDAPASSKGVKKFLFEELHLQKKSKYDIYSAKWITPVKEFRNSDGSKRVGRTVEYTLYEKMATYKTTFGTNYKFPDIKKYDVVATYEAEVDTFPAKIMMRTAVYEPINEDNSLIEKVMPTKVLNTADKFIQEVLPYIMGSLAVASVLLAMMIFVLGRDDNEEYEQV